MPEPPPAILPPVTPLQHVEAQVTPPPPAPAASTMSRNSGAILPGIIPDSISRALPEFLRHSLGSVTGEVAQKMGELQDLASRGMCDQLEVATAKLNPQSNPKWSQSRRRLLELRATCFDLTGHGDKARLIRQELQRP